VCVRCLVLFKLKDAWHYIIAQKGKRKKKFDQALRALVAVALFKPGN
jgi:hypothetical protein